MRNRYTDELIEAVMINDILRVINLLNRGADPNDFDDPVFRHTSLHYAAMHNAYESALVLIEADGNVRAKNIEELTPLSFAETNSYRMTDLLQKLTLSKGTKLC